MADTDNKNPAQTGQDDFNSRHKDDLSVGRFAKVSATETLIPLVAAGAAGVAGYYALGKPIKALMPNVIKGIEGVEFLGGAALDGLKEGEFLKKIGEVSVKLGSTFKEKLDEVNRAAGKGDTFSVVRGLQALREVHKDLSPEQINEVRVIFNLPPQDFEKTAKKIGAGAAGFVGLMGGGMAVGYDHWRKEESERLAAEEINRDVAKLELFKPSDPELVAENKRLRTMLAEEEAKRPAANDPEMKISHAQHEGAMQDHGLQRG